MRRVEGAKFRAPAGASHKYTPKAMYTSVMNRKKYRIRRLEEDCPSRSSVVGRLDICVVLSQVGERVDFTTWPVE